MEICVNLPTLHRGQIDALNAHKEHRFIATRCGRRWGKTVLVTTLTADRALKGKQVGLFAPEHRFLIEPFSTIRSVLGDAIKSSSEMKGEINVYGGGKIDFWSLDNPNAGRGRKYHLAIVDEAAFAKTNLVEQWRRNIRPTLVDYRGGAVVCSNTNGADDQNFFWQICNQKNLGFYDFHAPSSSNPHLPPEELAEWQASAHPMVWMQEALAEFVNWSGVQFFSTDKLLIDGVAPEWPTTCDAVFAIIDSAAKTGKANDGTAAVYFAYTRNPLTGPNLYVLDYDLVQIEGAMLEVWLPSVLRNLETMAKKCNARAGSIGALIEDKSSGTILLQQATRRNLPVRAIESKLTQMGKSERAISVSGYVHNNQVKFTRHAFEKTVTYKEITRNHLLGQVTGFRVGADDKHAQDDALDSFCYGIAIALGDSSGF